MRVFVSSFAFAVTPAKAGAQGDDPARQFLDLDPGLRRDDGLEAPIREYLSR
jgi:hypothetical protein